MLGLPSLAAEMSLMTGRNVAKVIIVCAGHQRFSKCNDDDDHQHYHYHQNYT